MHSRRPGARRARGNTLILGLGIVALLSAVVAGFALRTRIEVRAAANDRDRCRARFAAWSGIERAKFELRRAAANGGCELPWVDYYGRVHPVAEPRPPLEEAEEPSFKLDLDPVPAILTERKVPWPSGVVGSTYYPAQPGSAFGGDYYVLRVTDQNALVALDDANPHLEAMLGNLAQALAVPAWRTIGERVVAGRPPQGFTSVDELRGILEPEEFAALAPYVGVSGYLDTRVIEAGEQPTSGGPPRPPWLLRQPRAPIDVNLAPVPVLIAAFAGIAARAPDGQLEEVSFDQARSLAEAVAAHRRSPGTAGEPGAPVYGFRTWAEFKKFLEAQPPETLSPVLAAAVLANANPNSDLNDFVPDAAIERSIDKGDLVGATTELCFGPGGVFAIESLGVILGPDGAIVARARARSLVRIFERHVETTQVDFESDRVDPPSPSGLPGLRDVTSLPEYRNARDAVLTGTRAEEHDLRASHADGQLTFNVITEELVSPDGAFAGFLARSLDGEHVSGRPLPNGGTARARGPVVLPEGKLEAGSDLLPFGAFVGRDGRALAFPQEDAIATDSIDEPERKIVAFYTVRTKAGARIVYVDPADVARAWSREVVQAHTFELWIKPAVSAATGRQRVLSWESGAPRPSPPPWGSDVYWGAQARLAVWLEPAEKGHFSVQARFALDAAPHVSGAYERTWAAPETVRAGTWHHVAFSFHAAPEPGVPDEHTILFVDGKRVDGSPEPSWPTEVAPQARILQKMIDHYATNVYRPPDAGVITRAELEANRGPVSVPPGSEPIHVGKAASGDGAFRGLIDNVVFQGRVAKGSAEVRERFDSWRPSLGRRPEAGRDPDTVSYHKRTRALEWSKPVRILTAEWTGWEEGPGEEGPIDLGRTSIKVGWRPGGRAGPFDSTGAPSTAGATEGWTGPLEKGPWIALTNGYRIPGRGSGAEPFVTVPGEQYFIAITLAPLPGLERMAPILDDVKIAYVPWDGAFVISESEVEDD